ncbi:hypothetical protein VTG60DRAFT_2082 [Thermothelomyces hinnuleus]
MRHFLVFTVLRLSLMLSRSPVEPTNSAAIPRRRYSKQPLTTSCSCTSGSLAWPDPATRLVFCRDATLGRPEKCKPPSVPWRSRRLVETSKLFPIRQNAKQLLAILVLKPQRFRGLLCRCTQVVSYLTAPPHLAAKTAGGPLLGSFAQANCIFKNSLNRDGIKQPDMQSLCTSNLEFSCSASLGTIIDGTTISVQDRYSWELHLS